MGQKILCVDDQPANLLALDAVIDMPGVALLKAGSGAEALQLLQEHDDVALVLLDVQMGGMDGYEAAERMRAAPHSREIPIIFLTAINKDIRHVFRGYESGAVDYIFKPIEPRILQSKVRVLLDLDAKSRALSETLAELRSLRDNNETLLRSVGEGIVSVDRQGILTFANPAAGSLLQRSHNELAGRRFTDFFALHEAPPHVPWADTVLFRACASRSVSLQGVQGEIVRDTDRVAAEFTASPVRDEQGRVIGTAIVFQDTSQRREYEAKLLQLAEYDTLTGLANRYLCLNIMGQATARAIRAGHAVAVLFLDLDRFKQVNDTLGHSAGDELLRDVARRLKQCVREGDTVCRLGGDEFVIIVEGLNAGRYAAVVADKVIRSLGEAFIVDGSSVFIGASVGIVTYPETDGDPNTLLRCADIAMYQAKHRGRGNFQFFTPEMQDEVLRTRRLEADLRRALKDGEFRLWYQPQVSADGKQIVGIEALVRWHAPDGRIVEPDDFIPLAEETGLIVDLGEWVLREACYQAQRWHDEGIIDVPIAVSVNLSVRQVRGRSILETINQVLSRLSISPNQLVLEITEHMIMDDPDTMIAMLQGIKLRGVRIALDDFGVGYSSFGHLKRMPLDALKIDRHFIEDIATSQRARDIVQGIVGLGHQLGLTVVAEAVESLEQMNVLGTLGVDAVQGFCCYRPMPVANLEAELRRMGHVSEPRA